ncbi:MAG: biotin-independent malonate decarboxylase subunit gamma [Candidatus Competibacteraceae bacterium]|nr:biotin-independent malonate decarboxylase subunit gamma [Candidatus Competibacteraceae bacterium]
MKLADLLDKLFPQGHRVAVEGEVVSGSGTTEAGEVAVIGTTDHAYIGVEIALALAGQVLDVVRRFPGRPILLLVDTHGQRLSHRDELLGINGYLAHLAKCLELARSRGHKLISLVYSEAVSGGFLSFGMMADEIHALADAQVRVMNLPAMARITKIPLERLEELSKDSPVFAPGVENYLKMGGIQSLWGEDLARQLVAALQREVGPDRRRELGAERGGREAAHRAARRVRESPPHD